tara:strand:- start:55 stop:627 length:573 start_codon:yes stop_codon:yes gene_type:complete
MNILKEVVDLNLKVVLSLDKILEFMKSTYKAIYTNITAKAPERVIKWHVGDVIQCIEHDGYTYAHYENLPDSTDMLNYKFALRESVYEDTKCVMVQTGSFTGSDWPISKLTREIDKEIRWASGTKLIIDNMFRDDHDGWSLDTDSIVGEVVTLGKDIYLIDRAVNIKTTIGSFNCRSRCLKLWVEPNENR